LLNPSVIFGSGERIRTSDLWVKRVAHVIGLDEMECYDASEEGESNGALHPKTLS